MGKFFEVIGVGLSLLFACLSLGISWLTYNNNRKLNKAQPELVAGDGVETFFTNETQDYTSLTALCRIKLYINNFGTTDTLIDSIDSSLTLGKLYEVEATDLDYRVDVSTNFNYESFEDKGVAVLTGLHNWGDTAPPNSDVYNFYDEYAPKYLKRYVLSEDYPISLYDLRQLYSDKLVPYPDQDQSSYVPTPPNEVVPDFLKRQTAPIIIPGKQLTTVTLDYVTYFMAIDQSQRDRLTNEELLGEKITFDVRFIDDRTTSTTVLCGTIYGDG